MNPRPLLLIDIIAKVVAQRLKVINTVRVRVVRGTKSEASGGASCVSRSKSKATTNVKPRSMSRRSKSKKQNLSTRRKRRSFQLTLDLAINRGASRAGFPVGRMQSDDTPTG